jgi:hypothetical protein
LTVGEQNITFVDRTVVLVRGTANDLSRSTRILGMIAELRLPKTTAAFFTDMTAVEQQEWVDDLAVFCIAVISPDGRDQGRPSSWSAAVDSLASGAEDGQRRLIVLSALI